MKIVLTEGYTRLAIKIDRNHPAAKYLRSLTGKLLTDHEFNPRIKRMIPTKRYAKYDVVKNILYMPIVLSQDIQGLLTDMGYEYTVVQEETYALTPLDVKLKDSFIPRDHQLSGIEYVKTTPPSRKGLAIQTGGGKTVTSIAGTIGYGKSFIIVVSRLHHQWKNELFNFTDIKEEQIRIIQGFKSLTDVMEEETKPQVFIFSLETLRAYCQHESHYAELPTFAEFVKYFGIGTKIMDEVHLNFHACTNIDLSCNIPNNIYLTATFTSGNAGTRKIFNLIYPPEMRHGEGEVKQYTDGYCYEYVGHVPERIVTSLRGYNHIKYEKYLLKRPFLIKEYLDRIISPIIQSHYINKHNPGERMVIFFTLLEMIDYAYNYCVENYPDYTVVKYISGVNDDVLKQFDIIITTPKSCSCGTDIKQLRTVINTVSTKSPTLVLQTCGRLRELPDGTTPEYVDICDTNIKAQQYHKKEREHIFRPILKKYLTQRLA